MSRRLWPGARPTLVGAGATHSFLPGTVSGKMTDGQKQRPTGHSQLPGHLASRAPLWLRFHSEIGAGACLGRAGEV